MDAVLELEETSNGDWKNNKLLVQFEDDDGQPHPHCPHGPTLLFYNEGSDPRKNGEYVCSAYRDTRLCGFRVSAIRLTELAETNKEPAEMKLVQHMLNETCRFCFDCNETLFEHSLDAHDGHAVFHRFSARLLQDPTKLLRPIDNDKVQAQYFFDKKALEFFTKCLTKLKITKIICIGAPRLHAHLSGLNSDMRSFLLDLDYRFHFFYNNKQYAWYNMCNNHFFDKQQETTFLHFLKRKDDFERVLFFTDPPFGCRTEVIANTLRQLTRQYNKVNKLAHRPHAMIWVFPYFSETYIRNEMPELQMCDYKVNYTNHSSYSDVAAKARKLGSAARVFTNIPQNLILLPVTEHYRYCAQCARYTALENRHCNLCGVCPSKNGATYRHCPRCGVCVKPNYVHCESCRRCTQVEGHDCIEYQRKQRCWICDQLGHIESQCPKRPVLNLLSNKRPGNEEVICLICMLSGHNERHCQLRINLFEEKPVVPEIELKSRVTI